jgi:hypothetical protein
MLNSNPGKHILFSYTKMLIFNDACDHTVYIFAYSMTLTFSLVP